MLGSLLGWWWPAGQYQPLRCPQCGEPGPEQPGKGEGGREKDRAVQNIVVTDGMVCSGKRGVKGERRGGDLLS